METKIKKRKKRGFTLIELMIVLAVIALIGFIGLPNLTAIKDNVAVKVDNENCRNIERATQYLIINDTLKLKSSSNGSIRYKFDSENMTVSNAGIASGLEDLNKIIEGIGKPQQKGYISYLVTITSEDKVTAEVKTD